VKGALGPAEVSARGAASLSKEQARCVVCAGLPETSVNGLFDTRFGIEGNFEVRRCLGCGMEQLFPVPAPAELKSLYERYYNFSGERDTVYTTLREWFFSSVLYRLWIRLDEDISFHIRRGTGRLLDIGCNEGRTLKNYARNGFRAEGTELNETAAAVARAAGFTVFAGSLDDFNPFAPYDVAVLSNVLEHSLEPKAMLLAARRLLNPEGQVWISCPNSQSWLRPVFGRWWINWHVPFHITHFSSVTLQRLLEDSGFRQIEIRQITPALWVASSIISRLFARKGRPTRQLRNPVLIFGLVLACRGLLFPLLCVGNWAGRGDCLVAVAAKTE
jgi:SAM-dependent methyltransferase